jgi:predicted GTPase
MAKTHSSPYRIVILGAAGRDFHNFNVAYRRNRSVEVVAFTATQIPGIADRRYPPVLSGSLYPKGIPIMDEADLEEIIRTHDVDECVLSYSDISYETVMRLGSRVMAAGAKFSMLAPQVTMIKSSKPVVAVVAVRTGCGKSQTTRRVMEIFREAGKRVVAIRHPMPYGDLVKQKVQRFATLEDLDRHECTVEEREEYYPHVINGSVVYAGVDYGAILREAEKEADVIIWDGGNNDTSFYRPDFTVTVADPLRPGHELLYYPGQVNFLLADAIVINKVNSATPEGIATVEQNARLHNPTANIVMAESTLLVEDKDVIKGKRVLVVEDGPTLTHGEMTFGAGMEAARLSGAVEFVDPRPYAVGSIKETFRKYPDIGQLLPAMGYGEKQLRDLEATINATDCDAVVVGTPIDLSEIVDIKKPSTRVRYDLGEKAKDELKRLLADKGLV